MLSTIVTIARVISATGQIYTTIQDTRSTIRHEKSKRAAIQLNKELDLRAIALASEIVDERTKAGQYKSAAAVMQDFNDEIENQKKIARSQML